MTRPVRFLAEGGKSSEIHSSSTESESIDSDYVVILAALLCALICVLGLVAVARCAWSRRFSVATASVSAGASSNEYHYHAAANKGLKKKILRSLPILAYSVELVERFSECPICLTEFAMGDDVRVLTQCGHGFHVGCIDTWLGSHSSCPSCRQILAAVRCENCGGRSTARAETEEIRRKAREDNDVRFSP